MRIIVAVGQYPPLISGYGKVAVSLTENFRRAGHEVSVLTQGSGCSFVGRVAMLNKEGKRLLSLGADIVQIIGPTPIFTEQVAHASRKLGIRTVYFLNAFAGLGTYYGGPLVEAMDSMYQHTLLRKALREVDKVTFTTPGFARSVETYGTSKSVVPNGVSDPCIDGGIYSKATGCLYPDDSLLRVLFVGQLRRYKGVDVLVAALRAVKESGRSVRLTVVGDGPERPSLETLVRRLELVPEVHFEGRLRDEQLHEQYLCNDVLVLPSRLGESFGIVLLEARLHGLRVIASDLPGVGEVVRELGGVPVTPESIPALAEALQRASPVPPSERSLDRKLASRYSWARIAAAYLSIYRQLVPLDNPSSSIDGIRPTSAASHTSK